jgi:hypothetical protein
MCSGAMIWQHTLTQPAQESNMPDTLLAQHIGQPQRYWLADAYLDSTIPLGFDIFWTLTLARDGPATLDIETFHPYTNDLLSHIRLRGRWYSVESNSQFYLVVMEDTQATLLEGDTEDLDEWIERERTQGIGLRVSAASISLVQGLP